MKYNLKMVCSLGAFFFLLVLLVNSSKAAVYCMGQPSRSEGTLDLYQEIIIAGIGDSLYTAQQHGAGYLGFAGHKDPSKRWINFSIWDNGRDDLNYVVEGPDPRFGGMVERFGNEGTGAKTRTFFRWELNTWYKTYIKVEHIEGGTLWSGWVAKVDSPEWILSKVV